MPLNAFGLAKKPRLQIGRCFLKWRNAGGISLSGLSGGDASCKRLVKAPLKQGIGNPSELRH
jgi:hypothetical protein